MVSLFFLDWASILNQDEVNMKLTPLGEQDVGEEFNMTFIFQWRMHWRSWEIWLGFRTGKVYVHIYLSLPLKLLQYHILYSFQRSIILSLSHLHTESTQVLTLNLIEHWKELVKEFSFSSQNHLFQSHNLSPYFPNESERQEKVKTPQEKNVICPQKEEGMYNA